MMSKSLQLCVAILLTLFSVQVVGRVMPLSTRTTRTLQVPRSNAEAIKLGLPLLRPRSVPISFNGHRNATYLAQWSADKNAKRANNIQKRAPSATALPATGSSSNYAAFCTGVGLSGSTLTGTCDNEENGVRSTTIELATYITNINGVLNCRPGAYSSSCSGCSLSGTNLVCNACGTTAGTNVASSLDLNTCIGNDNGFFYSDHV